MYHKRKEKSLTLVKFTDHYAMSFTISPNRKIRFPMKKQPTCYNQSTHNAEGILEKYAKLLGGVWHFRQFKPTDLLRIVNSGQLKRYRSDEIIFQQTEAGAGMFVLFSGKVHLCKYSYEGQIQIISVIEPVIMFNEVTAIDGGPNPFTAIAVKDCLTWNIDYEAFEDLVKRYPDPMIGLAMLRVLAMRTRLLLDRCEDLSFRPVLARTAKLVLELSAFGAKPIDRHGHPIKDLSASIATVPETFSRSLSFLDNEGLISCTRKHIKVLRLEELFEVAQLEPPQAIGISPR
jgi:CRP-like cAMP-binding protein